MGYKKNSSNKPTEEPRIKKAPLPKKGEVMGCIDQRYGGNKMKVSCFDGKERLGRVPGRLKRYLWLRPGDIVIIAPWELDDKKGDILLKYKPNQVAWLRKNGYLEKENEEF